MGLASQRMAVSRHPATKRTTGQRWNTVETHLWARWCKTVVAGARDIVDDAPFRNGVHTSADNSVFCPDLCLIGLNNLWFLALCDALRRPFFAFECAFAISNSIYLSAQQIMVQQKHKTCSNSYVLYFVALRLDSRASTLSTTDHGVWRN